MDKNEFLTLLRSKINNYLSPADVEAHISYYSSYIDEEAAKGRSEEDVIEELGHPNLIAKTLIGQARRDAGIAENDVIYTYDAAQETQSHGSDSSSSYTYGAGGRDAEKEYKKSRKKSSVIFIIIAVVVIAILILITVLLWKLGFFFLRIFGPVIIVIIIISLITRIFRRR